METQITATYINPKTHLQMKKKDSLCGGNVRRWDLVTPRGRVVGTVNEFIDTDGEYVRGFHVNIAGDKFAVPRGDSRLNAITLTKTLINAYVRSL